MTRTSFFALAAASALLSGCPQSADYALVDGFEEACEGDVPCFWSMQAGSTGTVTWQETLPGEHGLLLVGGPMAILRDVPGVELAGGVDSSQITADIAARCDDGSELSIEVTVEALASGAPSLLVGSVSPPSDWDGTLDAVFLTADSGFSTFFNDVIAIRIVKDGTGTCEIDYFALRIQDFGFR